MLPRGRPRALLPRVDVGGTEESGVRPRFRADWRAGLDGDRAGGREVDFPRVLAVAPIDDPLGLLLPLAGVNAASSWLVRGATWTCPSRSCL